MKLLYKLKRPFWNGSVMVPMNSEEYFEEGTQPKSAVLTEAGKAAKAEALAKEAEAVEDAEKKSTDEAAQPDKAPKAPTVAAKK